jgi:hypothetical protein
MTRQSHRTSRRKHLMEKRKPSEKKSEKKRCLQENMLDT